MSNYRRLYRYFGFVMIGLVLFIISLGLIPALGLFGFILPWLLVGISYLVVVVILDTVIDWLEERIGRDPRRRKRSLE
jgi:hypothetical protein